MPTEKGGLFSAFHSLSSRRALHYLVAVPCMSLNPFAPISFCMGDLEVLDYLKLARCPRSFAPILVTSASPEPCSCLANCQAAEEEEEEAPD